MSRNVLGCIAMVFLLNAGSTSCSKTPAGTTPGKVAAAAMPRLSTVDDRYQSFNIEMIEVTGGRFWKPYKEIAGALSAQPPGKKPGETPVGMDPALYQQRPPIDLTNSRLRKLAAALSPAYVRVSGTWANTTYFHNSDQPPPKTPPKGFGGILTRSQWRGVVDFSRNVDAKLVTSFATGAGTRDASGTWTPKQARELLDYTKSIGGSVAAAEYMNEPTFAVMGGAPKGYDAAAYGRDIKVFTAFMKKESPDTILLGPGGVGEGISLAPPSLAGSLLKSEELLKITGPVFDAFSYHSYGAVSKRCASMGQAAQTSADAALSEDVLSRAEQIEKYYADLRDRYLPGKPIWLTETADAACGGNPWAQTFLDSFRYLDQLGRLAKRGLHVHMHNTLAASDYGLLDENTFNPRPNYWAAFLWRRFMGATVLDAGPSPNPDVHVYAHCMRDHPGGVAVLVINLDRTTSRTMNFGTAVQRYTLSAKSLEDSAVQLNGSELKLGPDDSLPQFAGAQVSGNMTFEPATITFVTIPNANHGSCK